MGRKRRLTIEQAIEYVNEINGVEGATLITEAAIYKAVCRKKLKNYGRRNFGLYDPDELQALWGPKQSA